LTLKRTILDRFIGYFSPKAEYNRQRYKLIGDAIRGYDAAGYLNTNDWSTVARSSGNAETLTALPVVRDRVRDLVRNNPYANKAINVIVNNTVGAGIQVKIKGRNKTQEKLLNQKWKEWAETPLCDKDGKYNFYGMQSAVLRSTVESGEVLAKKITEAGVNKLQLLESDYINAQYNNSVDNVQGLWIDPNNYKVIAYQLFKHHPGDFRAFNLDTFKVPVDQIIHHHRIERIGQLRGMPWGTSAVTALKDFADYQNATLIRQKVAACVTAFITEKDTDALVDPAILKERRKLENSMEPASIRYLAPGQSMQLASPPGVDQYDPFARQTLRAIAAGFGISYEALTGDYSQVNFSSGRMGHLEMQRNIDAWRWQMLIPMFCEPAFDWFLTWCKVQGIDTTGVTRQWTPPAREMIDPTKEIESLKNEVRSGFKTLPEAIRERGLDPDSLIQEAAEFNTKLDDLGLVFDTDARQVSTTGILQSGGQDQAANGDNSDQQNQENGSGSSGKSGASQRQ
jgi:lambda family phage portal protein